MSPVETKVAFAFPGVGVVPCGAEAEFLRRHRSIMAPCLAEASQAAGVDLAAALAGGSLPHLPYLARELFAYAFNCGVAFACRDRGIEPRYTAGFSLGIYSALAAAEAVSFSDGLDMVRTAHSLVAEACDGGGFGMGVIIGLEQAEVAAHLDGGAASTVMLVNAANEMAFILAGRREDLDACLAWADSAGAIRAKLLEVEYPYHHPRYLGHVSVAFDRSLAAYRWRRPICPVISPADASLLVTEEQLRAFTAANLATPINWRRLIEALAALGVRMVVECGPGLSLTQNAHFITAAPEHVNVKNMAWRLGW